MEHEDDAKFSDMSNWLEGGTCRWERDYAPGGCWEAESQIWIKSLVLDVAVFEAASWYSSGDIEYAFILGI